jgi:hypothetical protein
VAIVERFPLFFGDFGTVAVIAGVDVDVLFDRDYDESLETAGGVPMLTAALDSLPAVSNGTAVEYPKGSGTNYKVRNVRQLDDGKIVELVLEEVP